MSLPYCVFVEMGETHECYLKKGIINRVCRAGRPDFTYEACARLVNGALRRMIFMVDDGEHGLRPRVPIHCQYEQAGHWQRSALCCYKIRLLSNAVAYSTPA